MPKDLLTYLAALTPLELPRFLLLTVTARIPTMLANTFASSELLGRADAAAMRRFRPPAG